MLPGGVKPGEATPFQGNALDPAALMDRLTRLQADRARAERRLGREGAPDVSGLTATAAKELIGGI